MTYLRPSLRQRLSLRLWAAVVLFALVTTAGAGQLSRKERALTAKEETIARQQLFTAWKDSVRTALEPSYLTKMLRIGGDSMKLAWTVYDSKPADGYALYISLHGGGGAPSQVNDSQWENQQRLYKPQHAVYLCPRGISDTWDLHFRPQSDDFYRQVIMMMVAYCDVNPDKVYLMGYSAGGDGVWRLAPRMADSWAAASMMAGHPGDVSLVNLRNLPFMIWCGEQDAAYDRNRQCEHRIAEMDSLHQDDRDGYLFEGHMQQGKGHWMDLTDVAAVPWMARHRRHAYPKKIVWLQTEVTKPHFYWISAPEEELQKGKEVRAEIDGNTITITKCDYSMLTISLNDQLVDLDKPVTVRYQGKKVFKGKVKRLRSTLRHTLYARNDPSYMFPSQLQVLLPRSYPE
ncbi:MAG: alpha/beta hydrolase [Prevotella sp.]|nr:alpha/beta hydrolase [Prevotella sp.]